jgi:hypothetical protein
MAKDLTGRLTLITGAARGIGLATAEAFLRAGAPVAICDIDEQTAASAAESLRHIGPDVRSYRLDVRDREAWEVLVDRLESERAPVDILVNNAGIMPICPFLEEDPVLNQRQIDINLHGVSNGMHTVLPRMRARGWGHVTNIASVAGKVGTPYIAFYSATKFAVIGLTEAVRYEMRDTGITFTYVMPALVDTELISGTGRPVWPPPAKASDVAAAVVSSAQKGKVDVFVPRVARIAAILPALLPRAVYERIGDLLEMGNMFENVDPSGRSAYRDRIRAH